MEQENFNQKTSHYATRVEKALNAYLPAVSQQPQKLHEAMRYAVLKGGKRIRPLLVYASGEALGIPAQQLDTCACAVELIHAYSLVHDDLPAMDNDDLRRNQATVHIAFDEATAILVGDALQTLAFHILASDPNTRINSIQLLTQASGSLGMCGGQALDIAGENQQLDLDQLEQIHQLKTGELIRAAILLPCFSLPTIEEKITEQLSRFAQCIGLAFQIRDDILDIEGDTLIIGKPQGSDQAQHKSTYPALLGMKNAKQKADDLFKEANEILLTFGEQAELLHCLAKYIVYRDR